MVFLRASSRRCLAMLLFLSDAAQRTLLRLLAINITIMCFLDQQLSAGDFGGDEVRGREMEPGIKYGRDSVDFLIRDCISFSKLIVRR